MKREVVGGRQFTLAVASGEGVAERWRRGYGPPDNTWPRTVHGDSATTYDALCALGPSPDPDEVVRVIGNKSWTHPYCNVCEEYVPRAVRMGRDDGEVYACLACLVAAAEALR